jgi:serine/threonine protein kinase
LSSFPCPNCRTPNSELNPRCRKCGIALPPTPTSLQSRPLHELARGEWDRPLVGRVLAHYRVLREIGAGGMGRVFAAEDSRLRRSVALKVLSPALAQDPERLQRFGREARAVAALNHPNIVTLHSVEEADDLHFLTMELVEGQTLDRLIPVGGVSLETFFELVPPIAEALDAAHSRGILHRDLKPANIMRSVEGMVKILDFGLAKLELEQDAVLEASVDSDAVTPPKSTGDLLLDTATSRSSWRTGDHVLGTIPYMSPEQLRGQQLDRRSDLFSLGVVLYELATGQRPFHGQTAAEVITAILRDAPLPARELRPDLPPALSDLIGRLLAKMPEDRFHSARELCGCLDALRREPGAAEPPVPASSARRWAPPALAAAMLLPGLWLVTWQSGLFQPDRSAWSESARTGAAVLRPHKTLRVTTGPGEEYGSRISPDGKWLSWIAAPQGDYHVWIQRLDGVEPVGEPQALTPPTPNRITSSVWSPDGKEIAYLHVTESTETALRIIRLSDGSQTNLKRLDLGWPTYLSRWRDTGIFLAGQQSIWRLEPRSGELTRRLLATDFSLKDTGAVDVCDDGRSAVVAGYLKTDADAGQRDLWLVDLEDGSSTRLLNDSFNERGPRWSGAGCRSLVYSSDQTGETAVWHLELDGRQPQWSAQSGALGLVEDASADGSIVLVQREHQASFHLLSVDLATGLQVQVTDDSLRSLWPSAAANAQVVAFQQMKPRPGRSEFFGDARILLASTELESFHRASVAIEDGYGARVSPDGRWLAFLRTPLERPTEPRQSAYFEPEIWLAPVQGGRPARIADRAQYTANIDFPLELLAQNLVWSADSARLYFVRKDGAGAPELWALQPSDLQGVQPKRLTKGAPQSAVMIDVHPSEDGSRVAYTLWLLPELSFEIHELDLQTATDRLVRRFHLERQGFVKTAAWIDSDRLLVLECQWEDPAWNVEVGLVSRGGQRSRLGSIPSAFPPTARYDATRRALFITTVKEGVHNVVMVPIDRFSPQAVTRNPFSGTTFSGVEFLQSAELLLGVQKQNKDVWLNHLVQMRQGGRR